MIDFYYWPTPNGWKVSIMLEECGLEYRVIPINIGKGDQFKPEFLKISPNNRMPAIVDHDEPGGSMAIFESGAILLHLAEKTGRLAPTERRGRKEMMEWLFWQVGNLGPMAGQLSHFVNYAQGAHPYSLGRYKNEYNRCLGVLERRLDGRDYILGDDYSIADIISWPRGADRQTAWPGDRGIPQCRALACRGARPAGGQARRRSRQGAAPRRPAERRGTHVGTGQGTVIRVTSFAPGSPGFMHRTETCDYAILLSGECDLELDDGKTVHMKPGDICVQRGTMHAWVNRGSEPAVFAFILVDAEPVEMAGQTLTTHYPSR